MYMSTMKLKAAHLTLSTFTKMLQNKTFHVQKDNVVALIYVAKMKATSSLDVTNLEKQLVLAAVESN